MPWASPLKTTGLPRTLTPAPGAFPPAASLGPGGLRRLTKSPAEGPASSADYSGARRAPAPQVDFPFSNDSK